MQRGGRRSKNTCVCTSPKASCSLLCSYFVFTAVGFTVKLDFDVIIDYFKQFGELKYIEGNYMTFILYIVYVDESLVLDSIASQDHMFNCEKLHIQSHSAAGEKLKI